MCTLSTRGACFLLAYSRALPVAHLPLCLQGDSLVMLALKYLHDASTTSKVNALRFLRQLLGSPSVSCWQMPC